MYKKKIILFVFLVAVISIPIVVWNFHDSGNFGEKEANFIKGIGYTTWSREGYINPRSMASIKALSETGAKSMSILITWYQENIRSKEIKRTNMTPSDEAIITAIRKAHELGMTVMLKPHLELLDMSDGGWRGEIGQNTEEDWEEWFANYRNYIMYYVDIAEKENVEFFCIGTELSVVDTTKGYMFRDLIEEIRDKYKGALTYAAHWDAYRDIRFWDKLDYIGINPFFPISEKKDPSYQDLMDGWRKWLPEMEKFQAKWNMPIIFPEAGCKSCDYAAAKPWEHSPQGNVNLDLQADYYNALMITFLDKKWFEGLYWWSWRTNPSFGGVHNRGFTPQNKPAEALIKQWYELPRKDYNTLVPQLSEEGVADRMTYLFGGKTGEPAEIGKTGETGAPVSGGIFFNASDPGKTTHLYVSNIDAYKIVAGKILNKLIPGDIITLAAFDGSSTRAVYQVVDVADSGEMFNITVIPVYSNGIFEKNARLGFTSAGARTMSLGYISYLFEKNTRQVPGERFIALDNDNPSAVSCVYVSNTDKGGFERDRVLREITPGDMLYLFATDGTGAQAVYQVTSVVAADDHYNINVMPVSSEGDFNDNASVGLCYTRYNDISVLYFFSEDTTSVAPESGHVEMDVSVPREVTHIYIYDIDAKGKIMERALDGIKAGDFLTFSGEDGSVARMTYIVTAVSDAGPYHDFTVNYVSSEGFFEGGEKMRMTTAGIDLLPALYLFSKETDSMPGPGQVILNNTDPVTATHIFAYASDTNGIIRDRIFKKIIKGDIIKLKALDSDAIAVYQVVKIRSNRDIHDITVIPVCSRGVFKDKLRLELTATAADFTPLMYLFSEKIEGISPEEGSLSLDNVDPVSASALYVNKKDNDGNMNGSLFNSVSPEDLITLISAEGGDGRVTYRVKSVSDGGESYSIMVIPVSAENTFRTGERIAFVHTTQDACRTPGPKK